MRLDDALTQIHQMRHTLACTGTFRGYRVSAVAFSAVTAIAGGMAQSVWIPHPGDALGRWVGLWVAIAGVNLLIAAVSIWRHCRDSGSCLNRDMAMVAVERFVPFLVAGAMLAAVIVLVAPEVAWLLPGLWSMLFGLSVFASWRILPRPTFWIGSYYLFASLICIGFGRSDQSFAPWTMMLPFVAGQALAACVLYFSLERNRAET